MLDFDVPVLYLCLNIAISVLYDVKFLLLQVLPQLHRMSSRDCVAQCYRIITDKFL